MIKKAFCVLYNGIRFIGHPCYRNLLAVDTSTRVERSRKAKIQIGSKFRTRRNVELNARGDAQISIGNDVFMNSGCIITARKKITIGEHTIFGPNVTIYDHDHQIDDGKILDNQFVAEEVTIGKNVWVGAGSIILKGSCIEDNCVIAAGSVVKGRVPSGCIFVQKREKSMLPLK